jgi:hypothetical protein
LKEGFLNAGIKGFVRKRMESGLFLSLPNLQNCPATPENLLAMKVHPSRHGAQDLNATVFLMKRLQLKTEEKI